MGTLLCSSTPAAAVGSRYLGEALVQHMTAQVTLSEQSMLQEKQDANLQLGSKGSSQGDSAQDSAIEHPCVHQLQL